MRFVEGIRNLVTTPAKRNERQSRLRIVPTADQMQTDMVWRLLTEQIEHGWDESLPKPAPNPDDLFWPALIGAWSEDRLVGGAFVMPDSQDAQALVSLGADEAAQAFERSCCMIQGIAVSPEHRREGIGLRVKRYCDLWSAQHDACLVLSIPTNDEARRLNEKAGYDVLPPQVALVHRGHGPAGRYRRARAGGGRGQRTVQSPSGALPGMGRRAGGTRPGCGVRASDGTGVMDRKASRSSGRRSARIHRSSMSTVPIRCRGEGWSSTRHAAGPSSD